MRYLILIFFSFVISHSFAQTNFEATYQIKFDNEKLKNLYKEESSRDAMQYNMLFKTMIKSAESLDYKILFNSSNAVFEPTETLTVKKNKGLNFGSGILTTIDAEAKIFTSTECNEYYKKIDAGGVKALVLYPFKNFNWKLTNQNKVLNGLKIFKANTELNRNNRVILIEAWYCKDLPYSYGPVMFNGLPGLIVQVTIEEKSKNSLKYTFSMESIKKTSKAVEKAPKETYKIISERELNEIFAKMNSNFNPH
ncbi:GLPGLI family protein [Mesonia aestuariivivens]|uniref:GLPGLI family protein n=1 Tax=Mesonia aestuariivivens TaxID=2796128 RepID=A0ABS6W157_9FLAO|nr:GLPGLI family protein [Mesonia aestuariivivens]MBW2961585.1 GLPGLI family protein [Mesonia aestuariivivens]